MMEMWEPCFVSLAWDVSCQCITIGTWKRSLLVGRWVSPGVRSHADKKEERCTLCYGFFWYMSSNWQFLFLALVQWRDFKEERGNGRAEFLTERFILLSGWCMVKTSHWSPLSCTWCLFLTGSSKINLFSDLVLPLWGRPCWDSSWSPLESLHQFCNQQLLMIPLNTKVGLSLCRQQHP